MTAPAALADRLPRIQQARQLLLFGEGRLQAQGSGIERCLAHGHRPERLPTFDTLRANALRQTLEANQQLVQVAKPILSKLGQTIADTRYFAILTNHHGVVVDTAGPIDRSDRRADLITRIGTDLSERQLGTTAIGAALAEQQPVWLHRGEHFFNANSVYSCAGAPLFGPDGACIGMLDLTGIEAAERPELKHLVAQCARSIENALILSHLKTTHDLAVRLNWPGRALGDETDGLVCLNADGQVLAANQMARLMLPQLAEPVSAGSAPLHASELFAMAFETLFDTARRPGPATVMEVPLWTGLRLHALPQLLGQAPVATRPPLAMETVTDTAPPLKDIETALIRRAVDNARGNVMRAAKALGISRATVYRRLGSGKKT